MSPKIGFAATGRSALPLACWKYGRLQFFVTAKPAGVLDCPGSARRVYHVCSEINRAGQRRPQALLAYGLAESDRAPDTYAEFLLRSRATILHEPAARRRAAGHPVK